MSPANITDQSNLPYNYVPTEWVGIVFVTLYGITTFLHVVQALRFRLWFLFPSAIFCGLLEVTGWSGRLWSSQNPLLNKAFTIQAVCLVIAPTPLVAANFIILGRIIRRLGPQYSRLTPRRYAIIFVSCDIISLLVQGMGGGIAAGNNASVTQAKLGSDIALGGTIFQLVAIIAYCALAAEFLLRYKWDNPVPRSGPVPGQVPRGRTERALRLMLLGMSVMTGFILIRTIYRVIEFADGWNGKVNSTQWLFTVFDGIMITLAMYTLNIFHPGIFLADSVTSAPTSFSSYEGEFPKDHPNMNPRIMREV